MPWNNWPYRCCAGITAVHDSSCSEVLTYVYEVGPVLAGHAETKVPPEARVFFYHLQGEEVEVTDTSRNRSVPLTQERLQQKLLSAPQLDTLYFSICVRAME